MSDDSVLKYIVNSAQKYTWIRRVYLFGSRVRGDHQEQSDYDFAFDLESQAEWAQFALDLVEHSPTLHHMDLVLLEQSVDPLKNRIQKEGRLIYERKD